MCNHCGCGSDEATLSKPGEHGHRHIHPDSAPEHLVLQHALLAGNDAIAAENRVEFARRHISCINLMGTPGAGKTQLLENTIVHIQSRSVAVLEGDQQTSNDARRIHDAGANVVQINTGTGCHLDARMVREGVEAVKPENDSVLFIENVGNLVCPALFDLGENLRIAMMAVTDGDDKPEKYPHMFHHCDLVLVNKIDLLPYLEVDKDRIKRTIAQFNPDAQVIFLSAKSGQGISCWLEWLEARLAS